jgi:hypothetical protein
LLEDQVVREAVGVVENVIAILEAAQEVQAEVQGQTVLILH